MPVAARLGHLLQGRQDPLRDHPEHEEEDDELDDESAVGNEEVAAASAGRARGRACEEHAVESLCYFFASTNTNRTMNTRLMKYMASTRPTMMNMIVNSRP